MKLRFAAFTSVDNVLEFVEREKIDVDNIISISARKDINISTRKELGFTSHYLWWKEGEKDNGRLKRIEGLLRNGALPYLKNSQIHDAIRCVKGVLSLIDDEVKNDI